MPPLLQSLTLLAIAIVTLVLIFGLWNMMKGGSPSRSQNLMRLRIIAQAVAVLLIVAAIYFAN